MFSQPFQFKNTVKCSYLSPPGIVRFEILDLAEIDVEEVNAMHDYAMRVRNGKNYGVLFLAGPMFHITKEAKELGDQPEYHTHLTAQAIIVKSLSQRLIGGFIMRFKKHRTETRLFKEEEEAIEWLTRKLSIPVNSQTL